MRLYEFFNLLEARAESLASRYESKILARAKSDQKSNIKTAKDILPFLQNLESKYTRYVEWVLVRWLLADFLIEDFPRVDAAIEQFKQKQRALEKKDINQYRSLLELEDAVGLLDNIKSTRQQKQEIKTSGIRKIVDNDKILLAELLTEEAACFYGRNTKWCTASNNNNMFSEYNSQGPVYILVNKQTNEKFQIHYDSAQVMDELDKPYDYQRLLKIAPQLKQLEPQSPKDFSNVDNLLSFIVDFKKQRWPEAEPFILKYPGQSLTYAHEVINGRWPEAEDVIVYKPFVSSSYAAIVLKQRWPEAEPYIMKDPNSAYWYAIEVIKKRWPEAEPYIMKDEYSWNEYKNHFGIK